MKRILSYISLLVVVLFLVPSNLSAQSTTDTVYIPGSSSLEISDIINADTSVTEYRVYVLDRGAIYYIETAFELTSSCKFIATGDEDERPPVLAPAIRADNSSEEWFFKLVQSGISVELNDLYLLSMRSDGQTLGWSRAISVQTSDCSLKLRDVVFDGWSEAAIRVSADGYKLDVEDCHFRNLIHSTSYFGGQAFLSDYNYPDSVSFVNNTFFSCNAYIFSVRSLGPYARFEHNTVVYGAVNPLLTRFTDNLYLENNLFYGAHAWGGNPDQVINSWFMNWPDTVSSTLYNQTIGIEYYGGRDTAYSPSIWNDQENGIVFDSTTWTRVTRNNVHYMPETITNFYSTWNDTVTKYDSVTVADGRNRYLKRTIYQVPFVSEFVQTVIDTTTNPESIYYSPNVIFENNIEADPSFTDQGVLDHSNELKGYVERIISETLDEGWQYELNFPPVWPLPENLAYSNAALQSAGTDGFAVGDLNWFPEQKEQWVTGIKEVDTGLPTGFELTQNYPNPFNPATTIKFSIPQSDVVTIKVYNVLGQEVQTLVNQVMNAGTYEVDFNASHLSSGVYIYSITAGNYAATKKMMLLK